MFSLPDGIRRPHAHSSGCHPHSTAQSVCPRFANHSKKTGKMLFTPAVSWITTLNANYLIPGTDPAGRGLGKWGHWVAMRVLCSWLRRLPIDTHRVIFV